MLFFFLFANISQSCAPSPWFKLIKSSRVTFLCFRVIQYNYTDADKSKYINLLMKTFIHYQFCFLIIRFIIHKKDNKNYDISWPAMGKGLQSTQHKAEMEKIVEATPYNVEKSSRCAYTYCFADILRIMDNTYDLL